MSTTLSDSEFDMAREVVLRYLRENESIANKEFRGFSNLSYDQIITLFNRMMREGVLVRVGKTSGTRYVLPS